MNDIYIVYPKENFDIAEKLYQLLSEQWTVWWDDKIVGQYAPEINKNIAGTKCILAIFSSFSDKPTVTEELKIGEKHTKNIIPLKIDSSDSPYPFGAYSSIDFQSWDGDISHQGYQQLLRKVGSIVEPKQSPKRLQSILGNKLPLPSLFMSVSSHETHVSPAEALIVLKISETPAILVSAYDLCRDEDKEELIDGIRQYHQNGGLVLIDSGNYEAHRKDDKDWKAEALEDVLRNIPHDLAFCFDNLEPSDDLDTILNDIVDSVERDSKFTDKPVLPIVHVPQDENGITMLPELVRRVSEALSPPIIAIPERELGAGMQDRADAMRRVRDELNKLPYYQPVHLLGTGNPRSIAILAASGADTFDGLEWCRFAIDADTESLHHFQNFDLLKSHKTPSQFNDLPYGARVLFHNLFYYRELNDVMQSMFSSDRIDSFAVGVTDMKLHELITIFPRIFR
ncbi:toll/interleukin-1 receptor domain-containing protein [Vibrio sp. HS-50-1]|uniref:toll/interleukin-1 receptor domain-containing protein n=1 Tax=Vibrio sp. HS-50-1 TaxID=2945079 RepID=UPI00215FA47C|nr:toll/interleukin-1 receptor domain-containing protein [Vibrio sp. HS-50-1]MCS0206108.1 toll/interleukin-1 receptor domain-containing protein [Vibrio sp. HS-50-1]